MALLISVFAPLATCGVIAGQYLENQQNKEANQAANQLAVFFRKMGEV